MEGLLLNVAFFVGGAFLGKPVWDLVGKPAWNLILSKMPWNKKK